MCRSSGDPACDPENDPESDPRAIQLDRLGSPSLFWNASGGVPNTIQRGSKKRSSSN